MSDALFWRAFWQHVSKLPIPTDAHPTTYVVLL